jgi:thiamine pyrophosphate-dependent acetolactate synthase large subunit-like protein
MLETRSTTFTEVIAGAIAAQGVTRAFGLMGAGTIRLTHHLKTDHGVAYHGARHETAAVGAADGYARVTGDVGVTLITWGPALTHALTGLITAQRGASPLVLVAGDSSGLDPAVSPFAAHTQRLEQEQLLGTLGFPVVRAAPATAATDVNQAFALARRASEPVVLLLGAEHETVPTIGDAVRAADDEVATSAPSDDVNGVCALLDRAERPVILGGRGAWVAGARDVLVELAERTGAVLATSLRGAGMFRTHPCDVGIAGGFAAPAVGALLAEADCVVAFGASLNRFTTIQGRAFRAATVVQIDRDPAAFEHALGVDVKVTGDAREVAAQILNGLDPARPPRPFGRRAASLSPAERRYRFDDVSVPGALDPREVCRRLDAMLAPERTIISDVGQLCEYPIETMEVWDPDGLLWMMDFGALGAGIGPAIGAALGRPERPAVLLIGDGGLLMTLGELDLVVRDQVPLLIVCLNDRAYGAEIAHLRDFGLPVEHAQFATPDLAAVARALGCEALQITSLEQLDVLADRIADLDGPLLLDCLLTQEPLENPIRQHA